MTVGCPRAFSSACTRGSEAFVTASLPVCVGPLTVLGSLEDWLTDQYTQLATKSVLASLF